MKFSTFVMNDIKTALRAIRVQLIVLYLFILTLIFRGGGGGGGNTPPTGQVPAYYESFPDPTHGKPRTLNDLKNEVKMGYDPFAHWDDRYNPCHRPL